MQNLWVLATKTNENLIGPVQGTLPEVTAFRNLFWDKDAVKVQPFVVSKVSEMLSFEIQGSGQFTMKVNDQIYECNYDPKRESSSNVEIKPKNDVPYYVSLSDLNKIKSFKEAKKQFFGI